MAPQSVRKHGTKSNAKWIYIWFYKHQLGGIWRILEVNNFELQPCVYPSMVEVSLLSFNHLLP